MEIRVGLGHDLHRLALNRPLVIGGIHIEHFRGPMGHSDGDVLLHALTDALLGAAGLGDIGEWFPNNSPEWEGADSSIFVEYVMQELAKQNWQVVNVDCTVTMEWPKLSAAKPAIRARIAELVHLPDEAVNVKAKTSEGVGPIGREEAIAADVAVLISRSARREPLSTI